MKEEFKLDEDGEKKEKKRISPKLLEEYRLAEGNVRIELKKLRSEDLREVWQFVVNLGVELSRKEVCKFLEQGFSYGAYVERRLVALAFAECADFDEKTCKLIPVPCEESNAVVLYEPLIPIDYEGKGLALRFVEEREKEAKKAGKTYVVALLTTVLPLANVEEFVKQQGSQLDKFLLAKGYTFVPLEEGGLAFKVL